MNGADWTTLVRFTAKIRVDEDTGCWIWTAARGDHGYGTFGARPTKLAHRVAHEIFTGPIPAGLHIDHLCRVHECVNPDHIEAVTRTENIRRGDHNYIGLAANWAERRARSQCPRGHPYDEANTYIRPNGGRKCRICAREFKRTWKAAHSVPTSADPLAAYTIGAALLACACARLAETEAGCPDRSCVIAGGLAWDGCECSQLTVAMTGTFPTAAFPSPAASTAASFRQSRCGAPVLGLSFEVTILRCMPTGGADADPPSCTDLEAAAQTAAIDAHAVLAGVTCCLTEAVRTRDEHNRQVIVDFAIGAQSFVGPAGACGGSALTVTVGILNACFC